MLKAHAKFLLSVTMILGVILLVTGGLVVNEANEALKRSIVHSSEGNGNALGLASFRNGCQEFVFWASRLPVRIYRREFYFGWMG